MQKYVHYLRSPNSQPLTICQYNKKFSELLDEDSDFQHACLVAWHEGRLQNRGKRNATLTNRFPDVPALRTAAPLAQRRGEIRVEQWGRPAKTLRLTAQQTSALHFYADDPSGGVPPALSQLLPECSHRAAAALVQQLQLKSPAPVLRLPAV